MELPTSLDQPLQGQIVCACFAGIRPLFVPRESVASNLQKPAALQHFLQAASMICTTARNSIPDRPSTVDTQLGRRRQRRQLLTFGQWNVRTLLDREGPNRPERRTALVAMELAKYNIDIAALCETRQTPDEEWAALQQVVYNTAKIYLGKPDKKQQDWFDPNDQELQTLMSKPGALGPPLQHTKMPADCYKNAPLH